uniref:NADH-ubiquinone oxidoreductase chain 5 n=1 Tax=Pterocladiophila hemisphaerica TaxID=2712948 RepID=A0A6M3WWR4_9FLOR|nr:Nad5 [Pterocladiophila hemisphaerica]
MYLMILFFPLISGVFLGVFGRFLGVFGAISISLVCITLGTFFACIAFFEIGFWNSICYINILPWFNSNYLNLYWEFIYDSISVTMSCVVMIISSIVQLYSVSYMKNDPHIIRFFSFLSFFSFFMLILITANNLVQMFVGWEGIGVISYLLINFWFTRLGANQSGLKALLVNRIGDLGLLLSIFFLFYIFNSLDYEIIFSLAPLCSLQFINFIGWKINNITLIGFFLLISVIGKSAQLGLHTWLPDAMEGPTPVSALIHAATLVTAGVFLLIRFSPFIEFSSVVLNMILFVGSITAFYGALSGTFQNDLKKVIAYSTCSQLGYMVFSCGMSCYNLSMFHLITHACFKALLFLVAGIIISVLKNEQDIRRMGSLHYFLPLTYTLFIIGSFALIGFPFLSGFYSKDLILELIQINSEANLNNIMRLLAFFFGILAVFFTSFYTFRILYFVFINERKFTFRTNCILNETCNNLIYPLYFLVISSIILGYFFKEVFVGDGSTFWNGSIFIYPTNNLMSEIECLTIYKKLLPIVVSTLGFILASIINIFNYQFSFYWSITLIFQRILNKKLFWDTFYHRYIVYAILKLSYHYIFKQFDKGILEFFGIIGIRFFILYWSKLLIFWQSGYINHYVCYLFVSSIFLTSLILLDITNLVFFII